MTTGIDKITLSTGERSVTIDRTTAENANRLLSEYQTSMPDVATPLPELAERFARLDVAIREHAEEMKGERKERRELGAQLKERLAEAGYVDDQQLEIPGFRGYETFAFSTLTDEVAIMVESGDTKTAMKLKVGRKRAKGWRR